MGDSYRPHDSYRPGLRNQDGRDEDPNSRREARFGGDSYRPGERSRDRQPEHSAYEYQQQGSRSDSWRPGSPRPLFDPRKYGVPTALNPQASVWTPQQMTSASPATDARRQTHSTPKRERGERETPRPTSQRYNFRESVKPVADPSQVNTLSYRPKEPEPEPQPKPQRQPRKTRFHPETPSHNTPSPRRSSPPPKLNPNKIPKPTPQYLAQAALPPIKLTSPQPLLLIIDLNGTLILRPPKSSTSFTTRQGFQTFVSHILAAHTVVIWSSAMPQNVESITKRLFTPKEREQLAAVWGRDKLDLSLKDYARKVQVFKRLQKVWSDDLIQSRYPTIAPDAAESSESQLKTKWDQTNTILIDDSRLKAAAQPYNLIEIPEFVGKQEELAREGPPVLDDVTRMLEILSYQGDVSRFLRVQREREGASNSETSISEGVPDGEETVSEDDVDDEEGGLKLVS